MHERVLTFPRRSQAGKIYIYNSHGLSFLLGIEVVLWTKTRNGR